MPTYKKTIVNSRPDYVGKKLLLTDTDKRKLFRDNHNNKSYIEVEINNKGDLFVHEFSIKKERKKLDISLSGIGGTYLRLKDQSVPQMLKYLVTPEMEVERIFNSLRYKYLESLKDGKMRPECYVSSTCNDLLKSIFKLPFRGIRKNEKKGHWKKILSKNSFPIEYGIDIEDESEELRFIISYMRNIAFNKNTKEEEQIRLYSELIAIKPGFHEVFIDMLYKPDPEKNHCGTYRREYSEDQRNNVLRILHNIRKGQPQPPFYTSKMNAQIKVPSYITFAACAITEGPFVFRKNMSVRYFDDIKSIKKTGDKSLFGNKFHILDYYGEKEKGNLASKKKLKELLYRAEKFTNFLT